MSGGSYEDEDGSVPQKCRIHVFMRVHDFFPTNVHGKWEKILGALSFGVQTYTVEFQAVDTSHRNHLSA